MVRIARRTMGLWLLALSVFVAGAAEGQRALLGAGSAYLGMGVSGIETGELGDRLAARGFPTFGGSPAAVDLGAYRLLSSGVMLGGEWHGLILGEEEHQGREVGIGGGYGPSTSMAGPYIRVLVGGGWRE